MTTLYHVTLSANAEFITSEGIKPYGKIDNGQRDTGLSGHVDLDGWRAEVIWLTHDPKYILTRHAWHSWCRDHNVVVMEVDVSDLNVELRPDCCYSNDKGENVEHLCRDIIEPTRIKAIKPYQEYVTDDEFSW